MQRFGRKKGYFFMRATVIAFCLLCVTGILGFVWMDRHIERGVPEGLFDMDTLPASPRFFVYRFTDRAARTGTREEVTEQYYAQKKSAYVTYEEIPQAMIDAFVAIEDKHFFSHNGVDWRRTLVAGANYLLGFSDTFGASTITQQLVKNMTGESQVTLRRKLQEIFYAHDLERRLEKSQIMELYLNVIHFSDGCNGIAAAAEHYFSKDVRLLSAAECATIAAITNNPSYYNPIRAPKNNQKRRDLILAEMHAEGMLDDGEYRAAIDTPLSLCVDESTGAEGINPWYTDMVIEDVIRDLMREYGMSRPAASHLLYTGGLSVEMAMDEEIQQTVEAYYRNAIRLPQNADGEAAQSALIVIDSRTGDVLGVAGAVGEKTGNHVQNLATQTLRPPGSTIKPLSVYAPAIEKGLIDWATVFDDVPTDFYYQGHLVWPQNATRTYRGLTNIRYAVAHSTNTVAVRVLRALGNDTAFDYAKNKFHLSSLADADRADAALALGQARRGVTLRELTAAYTAFADKGVYHPWRSYFRVTNERGEILLSRADGGEVILSSATAAIMTKLLEGVVENGSASAVTLRELCECAGKTGTTANDCDRWFIGYTPELVCGVWCGYEYPEPLNARYACIDIWNGVMRRVVSRRGGETHFSIPTDVIRASYCKDSGCLADEACMHDPRGDRIELGWFVAGSEPRRFCDRHVLCEREVTEETAPSENDGERYEDLPIERETVGLLCIERKLPIAIEIADAPYVLPWEEKE